MSCRRMSGEENGNSGNEEKRKHGGDKDPVRKQATETSSNTAWSATSSSPDGHSHWIQLSPQLCFCLSLELISENRNVFQVEINQKKN